MSKGRENEVFIVVVQRLFKWQLGSFLDQKHKRIDLHSHLIGVVARDGNSNKG